jgi:hypothetical protein
MPHLHGCADQGADGDSDGSSIDFTHGKSITSAITSSKCDSDHESNLVSNGSSIHITDCWPD